MIGVNDGPPGGWGAEKRWSVLGVLSEPPAPTIGRLRRRAGFAGLWLSNCPTAEVGGVVPPQTGSYVAAPGPLHTRDPPPPGVGVSTGVVGVELVPRSLANYYAGRPL